MFKILVPFIFIINCVAPLQLIDLSSTSSMDNINGDSQNDCVIGDFVASDCLECTCNGKWFVCSSKPCNKDVSGSQDRPQTCQPNMVYRHESTTCICTTNGQWTHDVCSSTFGLLPPDKVVPKTCDPDSYAIIDCNVCKCHTNGTIDTQKCTKNICEKASRRTSTINKVFGTCVPQNWYSFSPCQFCYCVNSNKLVCNTGAKKGEDEITLGTYKLTVCGTNLLKDAVGLVPDPQTKSTSLAPLPLLSSALRDGPLNVVKVAESPKFLDTSIQNSISDIFPFNFQQHINSYGKPSTPRNNIQITNGVPTSSSSEEKKPKSKAVVGNVNAKKHLPYYEEGVVSSESNEMELSISDPVVNIEANTIRNVNMVSKPTESPAFLTDVTNKDVHHVNLKDVKTQYNNGNTLRINLPKMLDKILNMALRKSNVKLDTASSCEPGRTTKIDDCNVCFCLVNGKQLCTDKDCPSVM